MATMQDNDDPPTVEMVTCAELSNEEKEESTEEPVSSPPAKEITRVESPITMASTVPFTPLEDTFRGSLNDLQKLIDVIVDTENADGEKQGKIENDDDFARLHLLASNVHRSLMEYGCSVEMGLRSPLGSTSDQTISDSTRETLRGIGKKLWMTIRSHPSLFHDRVKRNDSNTDDPSSLKTQESADRDKAAASGYIRAIAARLVLIDYIQTKGLGGPSLILISQGEDFDLSDSPMEDQDQAQEPKISCSVPAASLRELEFGVKCFARSGCTLLTHGDEPMAAYTALSLSISLWHGMAAMSERNGSANGGPSNSDGTDGVSTKNLLDEAFGVFVLLPDAASLVDSRGRGDSTGTKHRIAIKEETDNKEDTAQASEIGSSENILSHLKGMEEFVLKFCIHSENGTGSSPSSQGAATILATHRYLPGLARACYKHGHRFVENKQYSHAERALRIALGTTDRCLAFIRHHDTTSDGGRRFESTFHVQEQEMLVVSRECFYVLSHVEQALGKKQEAHKCLDALEKYVDQQSRLDKDLYTSTMNELKAPQDSGLQVSAEALAVEGPKQQDLADIRARAQAAQAKAMYAEAKERSNLAFSRIMLDHQSLPCPTQDDEVQIDRNFKELSELSVKFFGAARETYLPPVKTLDTDLSSSEYDALKLALTAASGIRVRRLLAAAQKGDIGVNERNPYDVLLGLYGDSHPMHAFIVVDHLKSLLVCVQTAYGKKPKLPTKSLSVLDEICLEVGKVLITNLRQSVENQTQQRHDSTLFPKSDSGGALLIRKSQAQFAQALSFYRDQCDHKACVHWADFLLQVFQDLTHNMDMSTGAEERLYEEQDTQQAIADIMAVKAYAMCMSSGKDNALALKTARDAWEMGPTLTNLATLFHCGVVAETKSEIGDTLLELDNALTRLSSEVSSPMSNVEILSVFPVLSNSCSENEPDNGGPLLLGIQTMWINRFVEIEDHFETEDSLLHHGDVSFFCTVKAYLYNIEMLWHKWSGCKDISSVKRSGRNLDRSLDKVLGFLLKLRDSNTGKKLQNSLAETAPKLDEERDSSMPAFLWDDAAIQKVVGEHADCAWIAEQLWNLALFPNISSEVSSQLFAKAHDFALLCEEEIGASLTKHQLDCELDIASLGHDVDSRYSSLISTEKSRVASDLCSEFSVQCLLLSVARVVDNSACEDKSDEITSYSRQVRQSLVRLLMAKRELDLAGNEKCADVAGLISRLELRCLIEIGNDSLCTKFLLEDELLSRLSRLESLSNPSGIDTDCVTNDSMTVESEVQSDDSSSGGATGSDQIVGASSMVGYIYVSSLRAKSQNMLETEKLLLQSCANEMIQRGASSIKTSLGSVHTLGEIQRDLVRLATRVEDVTAVLDCVDSALKGCGETSGKKNPYSTGELDWFAIEAYNKGVNLSLLGDTVNAVKLLVVTLNLLPFCGAEVESHGTEMTRAYTILVGHNAGGGAVHSASATLVMNLFRNTTL